MVHAKPCTVLKVTTSHQYELLNHDFDAAFLTGATGTPRSGIRGFKKGRQTTVPARNAYEIYRSESAMPCARMMLWKAGMSG